MNKITRLVDRAPVASAAEGEPARLQVTIAEAARMLAYGKRTLWRLVESGELPSIGRGRLRRIALTDIRAYQARNRNGGDDAAT